MSDNKYVAPPKPEEAPKPTPAKGKTAAQNVKLSNLTSQAGLPGGNANEYYHKESNKGEVLDLLLSGLKPDTDEKELKRDCKVCLLYTSPSPRD